MLDDLEQRLALPHGQVARVARAVGQRGRVGDPRKRVHYLPRAALLQDRGGQASVLAGELGCPLVGSGFGDDGAVHPQCGTWADRACADLKRRAANGEIAARRYTAANRASWPDYVKTFSGGLEGERFLRSGEDGNRLEYLISHGSEIWTTGSLGANPREGQPRVWRPSA